MDGVSLEQMVVQHFQEPNLNHQEWEDLDNQLDLANNNQHLQWDLDNLNQLLGSHNLLLVLSHKLDFLKHLLFQAVLNQLDLDKHQQPSVKLSPGSKHLNNQWDSQI